MPQAIALEKKVGNLDDWRKEVLRRRQLNDELVKKQRDEYDATMEAMNEKHATHADRIAAVEAAKARYQSEKAAIVDKIDALKRGA